MGTHVGLSLNTARMCLNCTVTHRKHSLKIQDTQTDIKTSDKPTSLPTDTNPSVSASFSNKSQQLHTTAHKLNRSSRPVPYVPWKAGIRLATFLEDRERDRILHCPNRVQTSLQCHPDTRTAISSEIHSLASVARAPWYEIKASSQTSKHTESGTREKEK